MEIISLIAPIIGEKLKTLFTGLSKEFGEEIKQVVNNNILEYQVEEYNRNVATKTLLHRVQPKNLKDFYQPLFIMPLDKKHHPYNDNPKRIATDSIKKLFQPNQFITLIGSAGSGKSTIVKYLFLNAVETKYKIPIKVELRYLNDYKGSIIDFIKDKIFKINKLATNDRIIEKLLNSGNFVFFLDGYDEINSSKKQACTKEIDDLVKLYNRNNYLLTSRPYTDIDLLPLFHNYSVCNLSDEDINQFIKKQIPPEEKELCDKIIEAVNSKENYSYKSFLSNPLLLSMFILTFQSYSSIPQKRSEFYSQVFDALFSVHDSMSKLAFVREKQSGLSKEQFVEVLKLFSFISYFDEKFIFTGLYLEEKLLLIKEKKKSMIFSNEKLIGDLQVAIGILNKEGTDYSFPHRSLQEYFAALYISSLSDDNKKIVYSKVMDSFRKNLFNPISKDNFYLLLSELDERSLIELGILPFLNNFIKKISRGYTNYKIAIDDFVRLHSFFDSFNYILKTSDLFIFHDSLGAKFNKYTRGIKKPVNEEEEDNQMEMARKRLSENDIQPFLTQYKTVLDLKRKELKGYLLTQTKSDKEIVSLI